MPSQIRLIVKTFRDKLPEHPLTLEDWVLAEKDLLNSIDADESA